MADLLLDYMLDSTTVANPDGSYPAEFTEASPVSGPGSAYLGTFPNALNLAPRGKAVVALGGLGADRRRFCIRTLFRAKTAVAGKQTVVCSNLLPFALQLSKESDSGDFNLTGSLTLAAHGRRGPDTRFKKNMKAGAWYTADLVYDTDTALLFLDGKCLGVYAFPDGSLEEPQGEELFIGTGPDGESEHFDGALAAFQLYSGIPAEIEELLKEQRTNPEWFVTYKRESVRNSIDLGERRGKIDVSDGSSVQRYERGAIMHHDDANAAFEMHGLIHDLFFSGRLGAELGYLVSDEQDTAQAGGRKNLFSKGGIYWSDATGAIPVSGDIYLQYEMLGESGWIGLPLSRAQALPEGLEQEFERARMYSKTGAMACAVEGAILERFLATGGIGTWGYPKTNQLPVRVNEKTVGQVSHFESCTIYWSSATGAHEIHGALRERYQQAGGPRSSLGFPTSDEANIPGATGLARYNTFENGSILWFSSPETTVVVNPFRIFVGRIDTKEEEGVGQGQNDVYFYVKLKEGNTTLHSERWPAGGAIQEQNIVEPKITLPPVVIPNDPAKSLTLEFDIRDEDDGGGGPDDHLGTWTLPLNMANGWGFRGGNGIFNSGGFSNVNSIQGSLKREVDVTKLRDFEKWWGVRNQKTQTLSFGQYKKAFRDVDSDSEFWDLTDWVQKVFYELVVRGLAKTGNCFGMCVEAINARKDVSIFGQPLDQFRSWAEVGEEFNIKHQYQVGAATIWWFLGEVLSGNTGDPKEVFNRSLAAFETGDDPIFCLARHRDYSGSPHVVLPVSWTTSSNPWKIEVLDPWFPGTTRDLMVNPDTNRFSYSGTREYEGGESDGGRFYYIPYSPLSERPRTPFWEAMLLIFAGTIVVMGGDGETESITDPRGRDLDGLSVEAGKLLKEGVDIGNRFVSVKGLGADEDERVVDGEVLLRKGGSAGPPSFAHRIKAVRDGKLLYALKQGLSEFELRSTLEEDEKATLEVSGFGTGNGRIRLSSETDKHVTLVLKNKLGVQRDFVSIELADVPVAAGEELQLNPRPGLAGIELVGQLAGRESVVSVTGLVDGKRFDRRFTVPLGEGISLKPSTVVTQNALAVASIAELFGAAIDGYLIKGM